MGRWSRALGLERASRPTPGQAVELALAATGEAVSAPVVPVPVGYRTGIAENVVRSLDPAAAVAFGINVETERVTRTEAMRVPAVRRGRALIAGTIGTLPLVAWRRRGDDGLEPDRRQLVEQLDPTTTPAYTLTWTVDDLLFHGVSWWRVTARDWTGYPSAVQRLTRDRVEIDLVRRRVYVDGQLVTDRDLIRFDGPDEGVLEYGGPTIRLAAALSRAGYMTATDDVPTGVLRPVEGSPELDAAGINKLLTEWETARRQRRTAYLNRAVDYSTVAYDAQRRQLTEQAREVASDLARLLNLPASRIGAPQGSGMTYSNTEADRRDLVDTTLRQYLEPIAQRLSMPDVTPRGHGVTFDLTAYLRGTTAELVAAGAQAVEAGFTDAAEVRTQWLGLPPRPAGEQLPVPTQNSEDA